MLETLNSIDTDLFRWINGHRSDWLDPVMWSFSQSWSWAVVITFVFIVMVWRYERRSWWLLLIGIALCFLFSDRVSVVCFKNVVCRMRPCHVLDNVNMYRTHCGGAYGFVSSHAANVFALAYFFVLRHRRAVAALPKAERHSHWHWILPVAIVGWALIVCYSRPYLGKHYPGDVICGAIVGVGMGALTFLLVDKIAQTYILLKAKKEKNNN